MTRFGLALPPLRGDLLSQPFGRFDFAGYPGTTDLCTGQLAASGQRKGSGAVDLEERCAFDQVEGFHEAVVELFANSPVTRTIQASVRLLSNRAQCRTQSDDPGADDERGDYSVSMNSPSGRANSIIGLSG